MSSLGSNQEAVRIHMGVLDLGDQYHKRQEMARQYRLEKAQELKKTNLIANEEQRTEDGSEDETAEEGQYSKWLMLSKQYFIQRHFLTIFKYVLMIILFGLLASYAVAVDDYDPDYEPIIDDTPVEDKVDEIEEKEATDKYNENLRHQYIWAVLASWFGNLF